MLHDIVKIVWARDWPHTAADIHVFAKVRKEKVLTALRWLKQNNILYHNIVINIDLLHLWKDEFVPAGLAESVVECGVDHSEKQGYGADLETDNLENDFHATTQEAGFDNTAISNCVYTNADQIRDHLTSKLILTIANNELLCADFVQKYSNSDDAVLLSDNNNNAEVEAPLVIYCSKSSAKPLNY